MTDYLQALLDQEREETPPRWHDRGGPWVRRSGPKKGRPAAPGGASWEEGQLEESASLSAPAAQAVLAEPAGQGEDLADQRWSDPAGPRGEPTLPQPGRQPMGPAQLYAALRRTAGLSRLAAGGGGTIPAVLPAASAPAETGQDWEDLDRAVQRDARRYDGGFSLY